MFASFLSLPDWLPILFCYFGLLPRCGSMDRLRVLGLGRFDAPQQLNHPHFHFSMPSDR